jgi:hypothetical protein
MKLAWVFCAHWVLPALTSASICINAGAAETNETSGLESGFSIIFAVTSLGVVFLMSLLQKARSKENE